MAYFERDSWRPYFLFLWIPDGWAEWPVWFFFRPKFGDLFFLQSLMVLVQFFLVTRSSKFVFFGLFFLKISCFWLFFMPKNGDVFLKNVDKWFFGVRKNLTTLRLWCISRRICQVRSKGKSWLHWYRLDGEIHSTPPPPRGWLPLQGQMSGNN